MNSTLQDAKLVPAALVYVSWESDKPVGSYRGEYLLEDLVRHYVFTFHSFIMYLFIDHGQET